MSETGSAEQNGAVVPTMDQTAGDASTSGTDSAVIPPEDEVRPWHGALNPLEALYQHIKAEVARLEARLGGGDAT